MGGGEREVSLNLLIEQTSFVFYDVKIRLHIPKIARGMDTVSNDSLSRLYLLFTASKSLFKYLSQKGKQTIRRGGGEGTNRGRAETEGGGDHRENTLNLLNE